MGTINTVKGSILPEKLGITTMHEHVFADLADIFYIAPQDPELRKYENSPVTMEILGLLRRNPSLTKQNCFINDEILSQKELKYFKNLGGDSIVDVTLEGMNRNIKKLKQVSIKTGLNIIAATGWYLYQAHPPYVKKKNIEELSNIMIQDLTEGIENETEGTENSDIKAGVIGECGCSNPVPYHPQEKKVLQASAIAQSKTGAAFTIHPALIDVEKRIGSVQCAEVYLDLIENYGCDLTKLYLSHADRTCIYPDYHHRLLERGITLGFDCFGKNYYWDVAYVGAGGRSDSERVTGIVNLCKIGFDKQITLAQDCCFKTDLRKYGGFGYSHILRSIIPMLKISGVSNKQINNMLVENPKRLLAF